MNKKNVLIVAHKFLPQMDNELIRYLNSNNYPHVLHIYHSFSDAKDRKSFYKYFENGALVEEGETNDYSYLPEPLLYIKELWFTIFWTLKKRIKWDDFIAMDGLCANFGLLLKLFGKVKKVIYWAVDFVPEKRFSSGWKNAIYHQINMNGNRNADEMWDLSPRMKEAREKFLGLKSSDYKSIKVVPFGMWTERIKSVSYEKCEKNTIVFMGHLLPKQGVQLIIDALPIIKKKNQNIRFKIIGTGFYENDLKEKVKSLKLERECVFLGRINEMEDMEKEVAKSAVAVAPYVKALDTWSYYADPGKVKTYLACGIPVLLTDIPWNAKDIEKFKAGVIITENPIDIAEKILFILDSKTNENYRKNAHNYAKQFNYTQIFSELY